MNRHHEHPAWCARGHHCALGEHRAHPIALRIPGAGGAVITRVRGSDGHDHAEIRLSLALPDADRPARARLSTLLQQLPILLSSVATGR